jgi:hypothetical protein
MGDFAHAAPRCGFHERVAVEDGYRYDRINIDGPGGFDRLVTPYPPAVGDLITLWDAHERRGGMFRVVERAWHHSSYGSTDWPYGSPASKEGPLLDIIVEAAEGPFADEVPTAEDEEAQDG